MWHERDRVNWLNPVPSPNSEEQMDVEYTVCLEGDWVTAWRQSRE